MLQRLLCGSVTLTFGEDGEEGDPPDADLRRTLKRPLLPLLLGGVLDGGGGCRGLDGGCGDDGIDAGAY